MINKITIQNFKSFKDITTKLSDFTVLVGPNNAGKSNFKQAILFLRALAQGKTISESLTEICGTTFNVTYQDKSIVPSNIIRFKLNVTLKNPDEVTYTYLLKFIQEKDDFFVRSEKLFCSSKDRNRKRLVLSNSLGRTRYLNADGNDDYVKGVFNNQKLAITQLNDIKSHKMFIALRDFLAFIWFFDFDPEAMKVAVPYEPNKFQYHPYGYSIASTLFYISEKHSKIFEDIKNRFKSIISEIDDIKFEKRVDNSLLLLFVEKGKELPFVPANVSDGVLRTLGIVTAVCSPFPPSLIFLEEIDKGIHFRRIKDIVNLLQSRMNIGDEKKLQVVLSTHNPYLIDLVEPNKLIILERRDGETLACRLSDAKKTMSIIKPFLNEGTTLGEIWYRGTIGGVPPTK